MNNVMQHSCEVETSPRSGASVRDLVTRIWAYRGVFSRMRALSAERRVLLKMTDRELRDIGITRAEAEQEARRPSFDMPRHRQW